MKKIKLKYLIALILIVVLVVFYFLLFSQTSGILLEQESTTYGGVTGISNDHLVICRNGDYYKYDRFADGRNLNLDELIYFGKLSQNELNELQEIFGNSNFDYKDSGEIDATPPGSYKTNIIYTPNKNTLTINNISELDDEKFHFLERIFHYVNNRRYKDVKVNFSIDKIGFYPVLKDSRLFDFSKLENQGELLFSTDESNPIGDYPILNKSQLEFLESLEYFNFVYNDQVYGYYKFSSGKGINLSKRGSIDNMVPVDRLLDVINMTREELLIELNKLVLFDSKFEVDVDVNNKNKDKINELKGRVFMTTNNRTTYLVSQNDDQFEVFYGAMNWGNRVLINSNLKIVKENNVCK